MSSAPDASNTADAQQGLGAMTVRGAVFLGVGSMVGAGIFALLGEAGAVAGAAVWLSFLIAGTVATLQGYAIAKLGAGTLLGGIVTFLIQGFGKGHVTAITSWLLYFAALIVTAMVSVSFGNYASALFLGESSSPGWSKVMATAVVLVVAAVNIAGARFIDRVQSAIVVVLLAVFAIFIVVTLAQINPQLLAPSTYPPAVDDLKCGADVLRLPRLRRHQLYRRRPARPGQEPATRHVPRARHYHRPLCADCPRRLRNAHRRRGARQR